MAISFRAPEIGGNAQESNLPGMLLAPHTGFEDRGPHQRAKHFQAEVAGVTGTQIPHISAHPLSVNRLSFLCRNWYFDVSPLLLNSPLIDQTAVVYGSG